MPDIESIIEHVKRRLPEVTVTQLHKTHPADDDGIWWFRLPTQTKDIQVESSSGNCPFMIEHDDMRSTSEAITAFNINEAADIVVNYLKSQK